MVVDPRPAMKAELEQRLAPLRAQLATTDDRHTRRMLNKQIRALKRDARRLRRTAVF
jgi:hypothetical protein